MESTNGPIRPRQLLRRLRPRLFGVKRAGLPGAVPGTLAPQKEALPPRIRTIAYGPGGAEEHKVTTVEEIAALRGKTPVLWIDVAGLGDADLIAALGEQFGLHRLSLEDVINVHQRPKAEEFSDHVFIVTRMAHAEEAAETEQVALFLGRDYLLTFQERPGDCFDPVRERIQHGRGRIREAGPDYLCYALIDAIIDGYFPVLEHSGERLESLEERVVDNPESDQIHQLHDQKRELLLLRRAVWPVRELLNSLIRDDHPLFTDATRVYLRDCYDHAIQLMDIIETYREIASGLVDIYISSVSAKMNEIMKLLTIIATIFIPLSFVTGLYGMNFNPKASPWNMPELSWYYGYPLSLLLMAVIAVGLLWYFRRKGWMGDGRGPEGR